MDEKEQLLQGLLDLGEGLLTSGAEVTRTEDTLNRVGYAYGASNMNVFSITNHISATMIWPDGTTVSQTRRIRRTVSNNFIRLEQLNSLSRRVCGEPVPAGELRRCVNAITDSPERHVEYLLGCLLSAASFTLFFGGSWLDMLISAAAACLIFFVETAFRPLAMNHLILQYLASFAAGFLIQIADTLMPEANVTFIVSGAVMPLIPGVAFTNAFRDIFLGETLSGTMRLVEAVLLSGTLAFGFLSSMWLAGRIF